MVSKTILRGGTLIDGTGVAPIPNAAIMIEQGIITAIGTAEDFGETGWEGAQIFDVTGQTVMPGIIDCHQHLDNRRGTGTFQERAAHPTAYSTARATRNALLDLQEGVTTVRDFKHINQAHVKKAIEDGILLGPHVVEAGPPIIMTGGHGWEGGIQADGPDAIRHIARQLIKDGTDVIKCMASGGFISKGGDKPWQPQLTIPEMRAAFDEAHKAGKMTTVHAHPPQAIQWAVEAGVDCVEHGALMDETTAELMARKGIWLVPTLGESWVTATRGQEYGLPQWLVELSRSKLPDRKRALGYAVKAGVKMGFGTDVLPSMVEEMQLMEEYGLPPMQVIVAATRNAAHLCGLGDKTGTLQVGKWADIIVIEGNPLDDLSNMGRVKMTFKEGTLYRPELLAAATGRYPL